MPTTGNKGKPVLAGTDSFAPYTHINNAVDWAETFANVRSIADSTAMNALSGTANVWVGLVVYHTSGTYAGTYWVCTAVSGSPQTGTWKMMGIANTPRTELTKTSSQTLTSGTATTITSWTVVENRGMTANASTGSITIPVTGRYNVYAQLVYTANATGSRWCTVLRNGSPAYRNAISVPASSSSSQFMSCTAVGITLTAGDVMTVQGLQQSGANLDVTTTCSFVVEYIGA